jgi:hypothetical protein
MRPCLGDAEAVAELAMRGERRRMLALITLVLLVRQQIEGRLTRYDVFVELERQRALAGLR